MFSKMKGELNIRQYIIVIYFLKFEGHKNVISVYAEKNIC